MALENKQDLRQKGDKVVYIDSAGDTLYSLPAEAGTSGQIMVLDPDDRTLKFGNVETGGAQVTISDNPPENPVRGDLWYDTLDDFTLYTWYDSEGAWIDVSSQSGTGPTSFTSANTGGSSSIQPANTTGKLAVLGDSNVVSEITNNKIQLSLSGSFFAGLEDRFALDTAAINELIAGQISGLATSSITTYSEDAPSTRLPRGTDPRSLITVNYVPNANAKMLYCIFRTAPGVYPYRETSDDDGFDDDPSEDRFYMIEGGNMPNLSNRTFRSDGEFGPAYLIAMEQYNSVSGIGGGTLKFTNPYTGAVYGASNSIAGQLVLTGVIDLTNPTHFPSSGKVTNGRRITVAKDEATQMFTVQGKPMGTLTIIEFT